MTSFQSFVSTTPFFTYKLKEYLVNIPKDLLCAIDSQDCPYYFLQGSWGVGKTSKLLLLKGLLEHYIKAFKIKDLVVLYIEDANQPYSDPLIDQLESYFPDFSDSPGRKMHKLLQKDGLRKIVLIDMWPIKNGNPLRELYRFTRPIKDPESLKQNKVTQIVAGSGSWLFSYYDESLVSRIYTALTMIKYGKSSLFHHWMFKLFKFI